jgi:D-alanine-D-alanine ligase
MGDKIRVGVLFGGRSAEHEVSVISARSMLAAIDHDKYELVSRIESAGLEPVALDYLGGRELVAHGTSVQAFAPRKLDVIFPLLHGPYGEDGTVQGLMELADVAYVGAGVLGSAVGMDKEMMRRAFRAEGLPQLDYLVVRRSRWECAEEAVLDEVQARFELPVFVKPVNLGSSIGVSKARDRAALRQAINTAAEYDYKVMIEEEARDCREVEVAILGNEEPRASTVGEIEPGSEFYDYGAKYVDDSSELYIPARLSAETLEKVRQLGVRAFQAVEAWGLSRVDFFVGKEDEQIYLNEINTMPGFTPISMYPKLWQASGLAYGQLIDRLIELALERQVEKKKTKNTR